MPTLALAPIHNKLTKSWRMFAATSVAASLTGTLAETVIARIAFDPAAMGPNGIIQLTTLWSATNNANAKTARVQMGAAGFAPSGGGSVLQLGITTQQTLQAVNIIRNRNNQASQVCAQPTIAGIGAANAAPGVFTIDTTAAFDLILTAQLANSGDTLTLEAYMAELFYGA